MRIQFLVLALEALALSEAFVPTKLTRTAKVLAELSAAPDGEDWRQQFSPHDMQRRVLREQEVDAARRQEMKETLGDRMQKGLRNQSNQRQQHMHTQGMYGDDGFDRQFSTQQGGPPSQSQDYQGSYNDGRSFDPPIYGYYGHEAPESYPSNPNQSAPRDFGEDYTRPQRGYDNSRADTASSRRQSPQNQQGYQSQEKLGDYPGPQHGPPPIGSQYPRDARSQFDARRDPQGAYPTEVPPQGPPQPIMRGGPPVGPRDSFTVMQEQHRGERMRNNFVPPEMAHGYIPDPRGRPPPEQYEGRRLSLRDDHSEWEAKKLSRRQEEARVHQLRYEHQRQIVEERKMIQKEIHQQRLEEEQRFDRIMAEQKAATPTPQQNVEQAPQPAEYSASEFDPIPNHDTQFQQGTAQGYESLSTPSTEREPRGTIPPDPPYSFDRDEQFADRRLAFPVNPMASNENQIYPDSDLSRNSPSSYEDRRLPSLSNLDHMRPRNDSNQRQLQPDAIDDFGRNNYDERHLESVRERHRVNSDYVPMSPDKRRGPQMMTYSQEVEPDRVTPFRGADIQHSRPSRDYQSSSRRNSVDPLLTSPTGGLQPDGAEWRGTVTPSDLNLRHTEAARQLREGSMAGPRKPIGRPTTSLTPDGYHDVEKQNIDVEVSGPKDTGIDNVGPALEAYPDGDRANISDESEYMPGNTLEEHQSDLQEGGGSIPPTEESVEPPRYESLQPDSVLLNQETASVSVLQQQGLEDMKERAYSSGQGALSRLQHRLSLERRQRDLQAAYNDSKVGRDSGTVSPSAAVPQQEKERVSNLYSKASTISDKKAKGSKSASATPSVDPKKVVSPAADSAVDLKAQNDSKPSDSSEASALQEPTSSNDNSKNNTISATEGSVDKGNTKGLTTPGSEGGKPGYSRQRKPTTAFFANVATSEKGDRSVSRETSYGPSSTVNNDDREGNSTQMIDSSESTGSSLPADASPQGPVSPGELPEKMATKLTDSGVSSTQVGESENDSGLPTTRSSVDIQQQESRSSKESEGLTSMTPDGAEWRQGSTSPGKLQQRIAAKLPNFGTPSSPGSFRLVKEELSAPDSSIENNRKNERHPTEGIAPDGAEWRHGSTSPRELQKQTAAKMSELGTSGSSTTKASDVAETPTSTREQKGVPKVGGKADKVTREDTKLSESSNTKAAPIFAPDGAEWRHGSTSPRELKKRTAAEMAEVGSSAIPKSLKRQKVEPSVDDGLKTTVTSVQDSAKSGEDRMRSLTAPIAPDGDEWRHGPTSPQELQKRTAANMAAFGTSRAADSFCEKKESLSPDGYKWRQGIVTPQDLQSSTVSKMSNLGAATNTTKNTFSGTTAVVPDGYEWRQGSVTPQDLQAQTVSKMSTLGAVRDKVDAGTKPLEVVTDPSERGDTVSEASGEVQERAKRSRTELKLSPVSEVDGLAAGDTRHQVSLDATQGNGYDQEAGTSKPTPPIPQAPEGDQAMTTTGSTNNEVGFFEQTLRDLENEGVALLSCDATSVHAMNSALWSAMADLSRDNQSGSLCIVMHGIPMDALRAFATDFDTLQNQERLMQSLPELRRFRVRCIGDEVANVGAIAMETRRRTDEEINEANGRTAMETIFTQEKATVALKSFVDRMVIGFGACPYTKTTEVAGVGLEARGVLPGPIGYRFDSTSDVCASLATFWVCVGELLSTSEQHLSTTVLSLPAIGAGDDSRALARFAAVVELISRNLCLYRGDRAVGLVHFHPGYTRSEISSVDKPAYGHLPPTGWLRAMLRMNNSPEADLLTDEQLQLSDYQRRAPFTAINILRGSQIDAATGAKSIVDLDLGGGRVEKASGITLYSRNAIRLAGVGREALQQAVDDEMRLSF